MRSCLHCFDIVSTHFLLVDRKMKLVKQFNKRFDTGKATIQDLKQLYPSLLTHTFVPTAHGPLVANQNCQLKYESLLCSFCYSYGGQI